MKFVSPFVITLVADEQITDGSLVPFPLPNKVKNLKAAWEAATSEYSKDAIRCVASAYSAMNAGNEDERIGAIGSLYISLVYAGAGGLALSTIYAEPKAPKGSAEAALPAPGLWVRRRIATICEQSVRDALPAIFTDLQAASLGGKIEGAIPLDWNESNLLQRVCETMGSAQSILGSTAPEEDQLRITRVRPGKDGKPVEHSHSLRWGFYDETNRSVKEKAAEAAPAPAPAPTGE